MGARVSHRSSVAPGVVAMLLYVASGGFIALSHPVLAAPADADLGGDTIEITTVDDSVHAYVSVGPWPGGFLKCVRVDGDLEFLPVHRIRGIQSIDLTDVTDRVLVEGKNVGLASAAEPELEPERTKVRKNKTITFRGYPSPETKWFFIMQTGALVPVNAVSNPLLLTFDLGVMRNLGPHWAVGVNFHTRYGDFGGRGVVVRGRRWLDRSISADLTGGFVNSIDTGTNSRSWIGQAHLNFGNVGSVTFEVERWKHDYSAYSYYSTVPDPVVSGTNMRAGGTLGYLPGVGALVGGYLILVIVYIATISAYE